MKPNEHRSGASADEEEDSSYHESDDESMSSGSSSSSDSVSYESGEGSFSDDEDSFTSSSASANGSDEGSSYSSSSSQHCRNSGDYSNDNNNSSNENGDGRNNNVDASKKMINSPSSLIATTDSSNAASSSVSRVVATNRTFQRGVLPISISTNGHAGVIGSNSNILTHRRGKKSLESNNVSQSHPCQHENENMQTDNESDRDNGHRHRKRSSKRHRKHSNHRRQHEEHGIIRFCINYVCCQTKKRSSQILIAAFYLWLMAQFYYFFFYDLKDYLAANTKELYNEFFAPTDDRRYSGTSGYITNDYFHDYSNQYTKKMTPEEMTRLRKERIKEARKALGSAAIVEDEEDDDGFDKEGYMKDSGGKRQQNNRSRKNRKKKSRDEEGFTKKESLKEGCSPLKWHSYHFPNCNVVHEIDLRAVVRHPRENFIRQTTAAAASDDTPANASASFPWGFVSNGLWRDVFSCDPREEVTSSFESPISPMPPAVLKIMKREHEYDQRNFQRHRRDALVMERLSSSHHLVPIYGYCANTVLTQAISHTLDDVIYARENEQKKKWNPRNGYQTKPPLESWMGKDENGELVATRETELGRVQLALGVFRGLMDLHEGDGTTDMEWLPVVHADLQAKQYLIDSDTGKVYLNDFNRCRFIAKKDSRSPDASNATLATNDATDATPIESCPIYIPTAPGYSRSPEEYNGAPLTEKLDVYSAGNILYGIITGKKPFNGERGKHIKEDIQTGKRPKVDSAIRDAEGTVDAELVRLLDRVYEADPDDRASAKEIVVALEQLLEKVLAKNESVGGDSIESSNEEENK
eukprot:scaffold3453_cov230-Skeletonema_marinoi.AAC.9